jgi:hypothetical protein
MLTGVVLIAAVLVDRLRGVAFERVAGLVRFRRRGGEAAVSSAREERD